jgi:two-component system response regulator DctR
MTAIQHARVFIIDDDAGVREALGWLLRTRRMISQGYDSAEAFWAAVQDWPKEPTEPCCALLDVRMPGMSGLALFEQLRPLPWFEAMPIIFLSGHADVATAVDAVKRGAFDFCEKPFSDNALVDRVEQALARSAHVLSQHQRQRDLNDRINMLTDREQSVMRLVAAGLPNKLVADQLQISIRTVEVHRSRVFDKLGVKSAVDLVNLLREA